MHSAPIYANFFQMLPGLHSQFPHRFEASRIVLCHLGTQFLSTFLIQLLLERAVNLFFTAITDSNSACHNTRLSFSSAVAICSYHPVEKSEKILTSLNSKFTTLIHKIRVFMAFTVCICSCVRLELSQFNVAGGLYVQSLVTGQGP